MHRTPIIVHVSDLHFDGRNHNGAARDALAGNLVRSKDAPDFVVVTGDVSQWGFRSEMNAARAFLDSVLLSLRRERKKTARCIVIRGNHDALPSNFKPLGWYDRLGAWKEVFGDGGFVAKDLAPADAIDFVPARVEGAPLERWEYFPAFQLAFLKIDSNAGGRWRMASGGVGKDQIERIKSEALRLTKSFPSSGKDAGFEDARRIVLIHHHVLHLPQARHEAAMLLDDAGDLRDRLADYHIEMILHGHWHRANQAGLIHWGRDRNEVRTIVLSAGSACACDTDDGQNSFHLIRLGNHRVDVWRPRLQDGQFTDSADAPDYQFNIPFSAIPEFRRPGGLPLMLDALGWSLSDAEEHGDREHAYSQITYAGLIDDRGNYWGNYVFEGWNASDHSTHSMPFHLTAVGAQDPDAFQLRATDLIRGRDIPYIGPPPETRRPAFVFAIPFHEPLPPGGKFRIGVKFVLPGVMLEESDFEMVNLARFPLGVGGVKHTMLATRQISLPIHLAVLRRKIVESGLPVRSVSSVDVTWAGPEVGVRTADGFEVEIEKPTAQCYLLYYDRLVGKHGGS